MYDRIMEIAYPKAAKFVTNIMNELGNKATENLKAIGTIRKINSLFGLYDCINI